MDLPRMVSRCLSCVSSARDELELLKDLCHSEAHVSVSLQIRDMAFLRTFLLCARNWGSKQHVEDASGSLSVQIWKFVMRITFLPCARRWGKQHVDDDASSRLGALVLRIEDVVSRRTREIHSLSLSGQTERFSVKLHIDSDSVGEISSFKFKIHRSYVEISNRWKSSDCSPVNKGEVFEVLDSLLEKLAYLSNWQRWNLELVNDTKGLSEKLTFLRNFLHFMTLLEVDEDGCWGLMLLTKIEQVLLNVARDTTAFYGFLDDHDEPRVERDAYHKLLQSIVSVKTCQELIASSLSRKTHRDREVDDHMLREIVDMLLVSLWNVLQSGTCRVIHQRDQLQKLYEGLRSMRKILQIKPKKFDEKMRDLSGDVVYETGLTIFSVSLDAMNDGLVEEMDLVSFDLLEKFKVIQATIAEEFPERSSFNFPRTNEVGFLDFLLNYMMDLTNSKTASTVLVMYPIHTIQEELSFLRTFMENIRELHSKDEVLQSLWDRVMEVAYKVEFLIDSLLVGHILHSKSMSFDSIVEEIKQIKAEALNFDSKRFNLKVDEVAKKLDHMPSQRSKPMINDVVVGFEDEARSIINRLTRGSHKLKIIPIVGMPGRGKTTLARKVYNDTAIVNSFHARAWCTVSQSHQKNMLLEILTSINSNLPEKVFKMSEEELAHDVKKSLLRNKYLIVLDDVWDSEAWKGLQASFPDDGNGSRVILTSRLHDVAPQDRLDKEPHSLRELTPAESWDLLKEKVCPGQAIIPPELCELRKKIVELCQGLPLTIVIVAGVLANMDQSGWKDTVRSLSSSNISSSEQCAAALELSYRHLPDNLKPCFLYFGGFPEDHVHVVKRLIWLWVAEGFSQKTHTRSAEHEANGYLMNLISRSLVMVSEERSNGCVKTCRIHDLLHEFCVSKAKEENFMQFVHGFDELHTLYVPHYTRRLCISSEAEHFEDSRLSFPTLRSLLFFGFGPVDIDIVFDLSFISLAFKLLRVLVLCQIHPQHYFLAEMGLLTKLRYLEILCYEDCIPSSIANLSNLETLILDNPFQCLFHLPENIWNMKKLRHLLLKKGKMGGGGLLLPAENLDKFPDLSDLDSFSTLISYSSKEDNKILRKLPNVRKLKLKFGSIPDDGENTKILYLDSSSQLKSLNLEFSYFIYRRYEFEFHFCVTLEKLTLSGFRLPWSQISTVANLPNLQVLKLLKYAFQGKTWSMEGEKFPNLEFLKLDSLDIVEWTALDFADNIPRLKKLVSKDCWSLKGIPASVGDVSTLEMIDVFGCPDCLSSLEKIKEEYTDLKIIQKGFKDGRN